MKIVSVGEAKNNFSALLTQLRRGETVLITNRGKPIAQIMPCAPDELTDEAAGELVQQNLADPPQATLDMATFLATPLTRLPEGCSASRLIAVERDGNR